MDGLVVCRAVPCRVATAAGSTGAVSNLSTVEKLYKKDIAGCRAVPCRAARGIIQADTPTNKGITKRLCAFVRSLLLLLLLLVDAFVRTLFVVLLCRELLTIFYLYTSVFPVEFVHQDL